MLEAIENAYRSRLADYCSVANAILHDPDAARDAVQDAFATAVRRRASFRGEGELDAWLWRIVVNSAKSAGGRLRLSERSMAPDRAAPTDVTGGFTEVHEELVRLPERQRLALFLRYYADLDYRTIAQVLDVAPGTVGATISAAHGTLCRRFGEVLGCT
jgi:RNA polymerase sigma-70 factor, ECF subfamily